MNGAPGNSEGADELRAIVLVGFMGSGKSTVGASLARRLGWEFFDADTAVEGRVGKSIPRIFRESGEERFRELEALQMTELLEGRSRVIATGGGWPVGDGRLEGLPPDVLAIWLRVSPAIAVARVEGGGSVRPLLRVEAPLERAEELIRLREPFYARAGLHLDTDEVPVEDLVEAIMQHLSESRGSA